MTDEELTGVWTALEPTVTMRRRIDRRVSDWLEAEGTPLAAEWLRLFKVSPFATLSLATASAVVIVVMQLAWVAGVLI